MLGKLVHNHHRVCHKPAKSLHRMLSCSGNPTMSNISAVFAAIKRALKFEVRAQIVAA